MQPTSRTVDNRHGDKRIAARRRVQLVARYVSENLSLEGHVTDLSADGVFFSSDFLDEAGEKARVWVEIPSRPGLLELRGEVRWVNDAPKAGGMGIKLVDLALENRILLASLANTQGTAELPPVRTANA